MQSSAKMPDPQAAGPQHQDTRPGPVEWFWRDPLLLGACALCAVLVGVQLGIIFFHPIWAAPTIDWIGEILSWPALLVVLYASLQLSRARWRGALAWWMWSAALLCYAIGHTIWREYDPLNFSHQGAFPTLPSLLYLLQYPFFFLAVILMPHTRRWESRWIMILDGLLLMGGAAALSWYFIMAPVYTASGWSELERGVSLAYPVGDLVVLFGLTTILLRPSRYEAERLVLSILIVATACLITADSWAAWHHLTDSHPYTYPTVNPSDLFWVPFYVLVPLAGWVQLRLVQHAPAASGSVAGRALNGQVPQRQDFLASLRLFLPIVVALLASAVILIHAISRALSVGTVSEWRDVLAPLAVSFCLLVLLIVRQGILFLENTQLRHEVDVARAEESALRELDRRKDEFLMIVSHELKTPLTSLQGYMELLARRFTASRLQQSGDEDFARRAISNSRDSVHRISRLVEDLLDESRIRDGRLALHLEPSELGALVRSAVEEQQILHADRRIRLNLPTVPVPILADGLRIQQVITNYLSNALKYSGEDQPVDVSLKVRAGVARVAVHDRGPGVPASEQAHVWERYYRVAGIQVQSGSGVGLGIGLYLSKTLVEAHGGHVGVDSTEGQGSTFWFTLPLADESTLRVPHPQADGSPRTAA